MKFVFLRFRRTEKKLVDEEADGAMPPSLQNFWAKTAPGSCSRGRQESSVLTRALGLVIQLQLTVIRLCRFCCYYYYLRRRKDVTPVSLSVCLSVRWITQNVMNEFC